MNAMKQYVLNELKKLEKKEKLNKYEQARIKEVKRILAFSDDDCGKYGKAIELLICRSLSRKATISKQNETDYYMTIDGKRVGVEVKSNGGRIGSLYAMSDKKKHSTFVIYIMCIEVKSTYVSKKTGKSKPNEIRFPMPVIMTTAQFLQILEKNNAIKMTGHKGLNDTEPAIQVTSKKLYNSLCDWFIPYDTDAKYTFDDFEGLEV